MRYLETSNWVSRLENVEVDDVEEIPAYGANSSDDEDVMIIFERNTENAKADTPYQDQRIETGEEELGTENEDIKNSEDIKNNEDFKNNENIIPGEQGNEVEYTEDDILDERGNEDKGENHKIVKSGHLPEGNLLKYQKTFDQKEEINNESDFDFSEPTTPSDSELGDQPTTGSNNSGLMQFVVIGISLLSWLMNIDPHRKTRERDNRKCHQGCCRMSFRWGPEDIPNKDAREGWAQFEWLRGGNYHHSDHDCYCKTRKQHLCYGARHGPHRSFGSRHWNGPKCANSHGHHRNNDQCNAHYNSFSANGPTYHHDSCNTKRQQEPWHTKCCHEPWRSKCHHESWRSKPHHESWLPKSHHESCANEPKYHDIFDKDHWDCPGDSSRGTCDHGSFGEWKPEWTRPHDNWGTSTWGNYRHDCKHHNRWDQEIDHSQNCKPREWNIKLGEWIIHAFRND